MEGGFVDRGVTEISEYSGQSNRLMLKRDMLSLFATTPPRISSSIRQQSLGTINQKIMRNVGGIETVELGIVLGGKW